MSRLWKILIVLVVLVMLHGCSLVHLRKDNAFSRNSCLITGNIYTTAPVKKPIIVIAFTKTDDRLTIGHSAVLQEPGLYQLLVPRGTYRVFAFEDKNQNLILDPGEPAGIALGDEIDYQIAAPSGGWVDDMAILLAKNQAVSDKLPADILAKNTEGSFRWHSTQAGAIMDIDDPMFSGEQGLRGFWSPLEFFRDYGANIYFLEPYSEKKIPLLLVHGAAGSPQDWRYFVNNIDRSRYQPWIYYYPSGARLKAMAEIMSMKINELHKKYNFESLYVTAHSMGGHVARYTLAHKNNHRRYTKLFVSISTPFGGEELAETGVEKSPAVIPSWKDMAPRSDFIKFSFSRVMPPTIKDYLFFGHKGSRNPLRPNNDSTVTLESMLDPRAQAEAIKIYGFNEDHVGILNSEKVLAQYKAILDILAKEAAAVASSRQQGKIMLRYTVEEQSDVLPLWMTMMFVPEDKSKTVFGLYPDPLKPEQEIGPINAGTYEVGLSAWGYKVSPGSVRTEIRKDAVSEITLSLKPQGILGVQIVMALKEDDLYWGFLPSLQRKKEVTKVSLTGNSIERTLIPRNTDLNEAISAAINNRDYEWGDFFIFADLPKGKYQLKVEVLGSEPVIRMVEVDPKIIHAPLKINLSPEK
jgi:pimeloyl-ACP methyl ester carboxylesterase